MVFWAATACFVLQTLISFQISALTPSPACLEAASASAVATSCGLALVDPLWYCCLQATAVCPDMGWASSCPAQEARVWEQLQTLLFLWVSMNQYKSCFIMFCVPSLIFKQNCLFCSDRSASIQHVSFFFFVFFFHLCTAHCVWKSGLALVTCCYLIFRMFISILLNLWF